MLMCVQEGSQECAFLPSLSLVITVGRNQPPVALLRVPAPESDGIHLPSSPPSSLCKRKQKQPLGGRSQKKKMQLCVMLRNASAWKRLGFSHKCHPQTPNGWSAELAWVEKLLQERPFPTQLLYNPLVPCALLRTPALRYLLPGWLKCSLHARPGHSARSCLIHFSKARIGSSFLPSKWKAPVVFHWLPNKTQRLQPCTQGLWGTGSKLHFQMFSPL